MKICCYYEISYKHLDLKSQSRQAVVKTIEIPYCSHPSERFSLKVISSTLFSKNKLTCGGDESKCPL